MSTVIAKLPRCLGVSMVLLILTEALLALPPTMAPKASIQECIEDFDKLQKKKACAQSTHEQTEIDCLLSNEDQLSAACKKVISSQKKDWESKKSSFAAVKKACSKEIEAFKVQSKAQKSVLVAFMMQKDKLSAACKASINKHIQKHAPGLKPL